MKFTVIRERFYSTLQKAGYFISSKVNDNGLLRCVHIEAETEGITVKTSSVTEYFIGEVGGKVEESGVVLVDFKTLLEVVKSTQDTKIDVENLKGTLVIKSKQGTVKLPTLDTSTFPQQPKLSETEALDVTFFVSKTTQPVLFAAATDETRPILTGLCFDFLEEKTNIVGTDGFRMSLMSLENVKKGGKKKRMIISARSLLSVQKVLQDQFKKVSFEEGSGYVLFSGEGCVVYVRLLDGEYPPYERVVPQDKETKVIIKKEELLNTIKTASLFAREGSNMIGFGVVGDELLLTASSASLGEASLRVPTIEKEGSDNKITFNYRYVLDFLQVVSGEDVSLQIINPFAPGIFQMSKNPNLLHIIMPIRTEG
ncbi:MAG: DNA polymerase III subunit beta [Patescibacteria group bacterium]|jgi:DNA polymerase-3 subunit beta